MFSDAISALSNGSPSSLPVAIPGLWHVLEGKKTGHMTRGGFLLSDCRLSLAREIGASSTCRGTVVTRPVLLHDAGSHLPQRSVLPLTLMIGGPVEDHDRVFENSHCLHFLGIDRLHLNARTRTVTRPWPTLISLFGDCQARWASSLTFRMFIPSGAMIVTATAR